MNQFLKTWARMNRKMCRHNEEGSMKAAIYMRVSRNDLNLDNQRLPLVEYAKRNGWEYELFEEKESTRKTRPVQWELYNELLKGKYDILLFSKLDRWARSLQELIEHIDRLTKSGVRVVSYTENIDFSTSSGRLMYHLIGSFAEFERDLIRERTLAGLDRARAQGKKLGRPKKGVCKRQGVSEHKNDFDEKRPIIEAEVVDK